MAGHEVAPAAKPPESSHGEGAAPAGAQPPAPTAHAMHTSAQTTKNETPKSQTQRAGLRLPVKPATVAAAALAGCTLVEGCTSSTPQVRPGPPAITCPQGWKETHKRFGIGRDEKIATVKGYKGEPGEMAKVKEGPAVLEVRVPTSFGEVGELPEKTLLLGTWTLGDNRLFGTFTEAKIPGEGTLPVCLVVGLDLGAPYKTKAARSLIALLAWASASLPEAGPTTPRHLRAFVIARRTPSGRSADEPAGN